MLRRHEQTSIILTIDRPIDLHLILILSLGLPFLILLQDLHFEAHLASLDKQLLVITLTGATRSRQDIVDFLHVYLHGALQIEIDDVEVVEHLAAVSAEPDDQFGIVDKVEDVFDAAEDRGLRESREVEHVSLREVEVDFVGLEIVVVIVPALDLKKFIILN